MKLKPELKNKKGETLAESVVTMAIFGILLTGITDFMSSQINFVARLHHRDEIINKAQILTANNVFGEIKLKSNNFTKDFTSGDTYSWSNDIKVLRVKDGAEELQFALP